MRDDTPIYVRWLFTILGLAITGLALWHSKYGYALPFLIIAMIPWSNFKSLKLLGSGIDFDMQLQKTVKTVKDADIPKPKTKPKSNSKPIKTQLVYNQLDVKALIFRHDIEDRLRILGEKHNLTEVYGEQPTVAGWVDRLSNAGVITKSEAKAILQVYNLFSRSIHGLVISQKEKDNALEVGEAVIALLDEKLGGNRALFL